MKEKNKHSGYVMAISIILVLTFFIPVVNAQYSNIFSLIETKVKLPPIITQQFTEEKTIEPSPTVEKQRTIRNNNPLPLTTDNWWNIEWPFRKLITIDHTSIPNTLSDFPLMVYVFQDADMARNY